MIDDRLVKEIYSTVVELKVWEEVKLWKRWIDAVGGWIRSWSISVKMSEENFLIGCSRTVLFKGGFVNGDYYFHMRNQLSVQMEIVRSLHIAYL